MSTLCRHSIVKIFGRKVVLDKSKLRILVVLSDEVRFALSRIVNKRNGVLVVFLKSSRSL
jgi:hypothetical protein